MSDKEKIQQFDVVVVGGGVSGTALVYSLCKYSNLKNICLIEKRAGFGNINSAQNMNSQTVHFGDIETNYSLEKASRVKKHACMVMNFLETENKRSPNKKIFSKYSKMVLAVGYKQVAELKERFKDFSKLFPKLKQIGKEEIAKLEPKVVEDRPQDEEILALITEDGYTVDFGQLSQTFVELAKNENTDLKVSHCTKLHKIKDTKNGFVMYTNRGILNAKVVVIAAGGHSIKIAHSMNYGKNYSILSIAGSFYLAPKMLNGKVYTMQEEKLPFAAIHGDPEVYNSEITRFGPTAKPIFLLERYNYSSFIDYIKVFGFGVKPIYTLFKLFTDKVILFYIIKNFLYEFPFIGKRLFLREVKKIVPSAKLEDIEFAKGYGGTRPQIMNLETCKLEMGEAKIIGDNIIFNITPSPGASTCLGNAFQDCQTIMKFFDNKYTFDAERFNKDLLGEPTQ